MIITMMQHNQMWRLSCSEGAMEMKVCWETKAALDFVSS